MEELTREQAYENALAKIKETESASIDSINAEIQTASDDGQFSVILDYVPSEKTQLYFVSYLGYTIKSFEGVLKSEERDNKVQGIEILWGKELPVEKVKVDFTR